jgi:hypothetical protein
MSSAAGLSIVYTNERDVAVSEVRFLVHYQGKTLNFTDRGSFAPHAKVSRIFTNFNAIYYGSSADCSVLAATFTDGSRWAPGQAQSPAPSP